MTCFTPDLLKRFEYLALASRRSGGGILATSLPPGSVEHCDYGPGADPWRIDWGYCARHDELLTRPRQGESDQRVYLLLDISPSMALGEPTKLEVARRLAGALAYVAAGRMDQVQVTTFSSRIVADLAPARGKQAVARLLHELAKVSAAEGETDLTAVAGAFVRRRQKPGVAIVLSDLYDRAGFQGGLELLRSHGYSPRVVRVFDATEGDPGSPGDAALVDAETGSAWHVRLTSKHLQRYCDAVARFRESVRRYCASHAVACVDVGVEEPLEESLSRVFGLPAHHNPKREQGTEGVEPSLRPPSLAHASGYDERAQAENR